MRSAVFFALFSLVLTAAASAAPLEAYGRLQSLDDVTLSPDGSKLAYVVGANDGTEFVVIQAVGGGDPLGGLNAGDAKIRYLQWIDETRLIIVSTQTRHAIDIMGPRREYRIAIVYDLASKQSTNLMDSVEAYKGMNTVDGPIVVRSVNGAPMVYVVGVYFPDNVGRLALYSVDPKTHRTKMLDAHSDKTDGWYIDEDGKIVATEEFDDKNAHWALRLYQNGAEIYGKDIAVETPAVDGFSADGTALVVRDQKGAERSVRAFAVKDGSAVTPDSASNGFGSAMLDRLTDRVIGYAYAGTDVEYDFVDPKDEAAWKNILAQFPHEQVDPVSLSDDHSKVVVEVTGPTSGVMYFLVDTAKGTHSALGPAYTGIASVDVGDVRNVSYPTSDGRPIDAFLTLPRGRPLEKLPLIVMPHGGPAARDVPGFDWWAQALASQGYAVLQPQFRGSDGYGWDLLAAGFGEFGKKMQTDLSDGVRALAKIGMIDPARVCIVGASYGGYAALAGATLDTGVYRCAASYGGISDLREMLRWDESHVGDKQVTDRFWLRFMGAQSKDDPVLDQISPIKHIDKVTIPVLLIHGKDDTVVPIAQSEDMAEALQKAGKNVTFVELDGEDHWLSRSMTRLQMLKAMVDFLKANNPP